MRGELTIEITLDEKSNLADKRLYKMIIEARGYVELFLEDLENEETFIEEPQEMLNQIMATLEFAGRAVDAWNKRRFGSER